MHAHLRTTCCACIDLQVVVRVRPVLPFEDVDEVAVTCSQDGSKVQVSEQHTQPVTLSLIATPPPPSLPQWPQKHTNTLRRDADAVPVHAGWLCITVTSQPWAMQVFIAVIMYT